MGSLQELSIRLSTLAVFRELQEDAVINHLRKYLAEPSPELYASFVSALYRANGGILGAYVREICENSENVYVQAVGKKEEIPAYLREAVLEELKTLQMTAELTPETLRSAMEYRGFLPGFVSEAPDIKACYTERTENIGKYGYGIYAKNRMFYLGENAEIVPVSNPDKTELSDLVDYARERQITDRGNVADVHTVYNAVQNTHELCQHARKSNTGNQFSDRVGSEMVYSFHRKIPCRFLGLGTDSKKHARNKIRKTLFRTCRFWSVLIDQLTEKLFGKSGQIYFEIVRSLSVYGVVSCSLLCVQVDFDLAF